MKRVYQTIFLILSSLTLGFLIIYFTEPPKTEREKAIAAFERAGAIVTVREKPEKIVTSIRAQSTKTTFTDKEMELLKHVPYTNRLFLNCTLISDKGFRHIANLKQLSDLSLTGFTPTPEAIEILNNLDRGFEKNALITTGGVRLRGFLSVSLSDATEQDLELVGQLSSLTILRINDSPKLTDADLKHLYGLKHLRHISFHNTRITYIARKMLQIQLPNLMKTDNE